MRTHARTRVAPRSASPLPLPNQPPFPPHAPPPSAPLPGSSTITAAPRTRMLHHWPHRRAARARRAWVAHTCARARRATHCLSPAPPQPTSLRTLLPIPFPPRARPIDARSAGTRLAPRGRARVLDVLPCAWFAPLAHAPFESTLTRATCPAPRLNHPFLLRLARPRSENPSHTTLEYHHDALDSEGDCTLRAAHRLVGAERAACVARKVVNAGSKGDSARGSPEGGASEGSCNVLVEEEVT